MGRAARRRAARRRVRREPHDVRASTSTRPRSGSGGGSGPSLLEVASVRTPCNDFKTWMGRGGHDNTRVGTPVRRAGAARAYLRVLEPGVLAAGDPIEVVHRPGPRGDGVEPVPGADPRAGAAAQAAGGGRAGDEGPEVKVGGRSLPAGSPCELGYFAQRRPRPVSDGPAGEAMPRNIDPSFVDTSRPTSPSCSSTGWPSPPRSRPTASRWATLGVGHLEAGRRPGQQPRRGLLSLGIQPEQRVGIASSTRYEWILADLAVMCAGGATTTVYPSTNAEDTAYILSDSECQVVFAEDDEQIAKLTERRAELPDRRQGRHLRRHRRRRLGHHPRRARRPRREVPRRAPRRHHDDGRGDRARPARHADLHLGHHRPPQGRAAAPQVVGLRGRGDRGAGHPRRERPAVPVAADGPLVRQGAALRPARLRLRDRDRRPGRQDRRQPRRREADVHGRRPAHLREGARPDRHHAAGRGRAEGEDLQPGVQGRPRGRPAQARGQVGAAAAQAPARRCSTGWSSARSASGSAAGSGSSSPARPRSTRRSPSGSTPPAS